MDPAIFTRLAIAGLAVLAGCASAPEPVLDPANSANIRIFHGHGVMMHYGSRCYGRGSHPTVWASAGGFSMMVANKKIGMPSTDDLPWSYGEFRIPAGENVVLEMNLEVSDQYSRMKCGPLGALFLPMPNRNYDATMTFAGRYCSVTVREIVQIDSGKTKTIPVATIPVPRCERE